MKKAIIIMMAAAVVTSCTPKRPAATTTAVATQSIITTTAGTKPQLKLNSSSSSQADSKKTVTKASEEGLKTTEAKDTSAGIEAETPEEKPTVDNSGNEEEKENTDTAMPAEDTGADGTENSGEITDVNDADLGNSVVQAGETVLSLPSSIETFESSGFTVDYDSAKYSDEDSKTYADAHYNGERVVLGYNADTNEVSEVIITEPGLKIPGGFTVGDTLQSFRDHFGYWGGDIYQVGNSEYTVYGTDTITKIEIKHK